MDNFPLLTIKATSKDNKNKYYLFDITMLSYSSGQTIFLSDQKGCAFL